ETNLHLARNQHFINWFVSCITNFGRARPYMPVRINRSLERAAEKATKLAGTRWAFAAAAGVIVLWVVTGPIFNYSDTWQLVINTGTTIVTFLMVFLIQRTQNKE